MPSWLEHRVRRAMADPRRRLALASGPNSGMVRAGSSKLKPTMTRVGVRSRGPGRRVIVIGAGWAISCRRHITREVEESLKVRV